MPTIRTPSGPVTVEPGPFVDRIREAAVQVGLKEFRVFSGDNELIPEDTPAELVEGMDVTLFPYNLVA